MRGEAVLRRRSVAVLASVAMVAALFAFAADRAEAINGDGPEVFTLTLLHNNDGESQVINAGSGLEDYGGAARFKALVDQQRAAATTDGVMLVSSGDNFLAGPEFDAGLQNGIPFYDTIVMDQLDYDAVALGNHDFDFGPDILADFIAGYTSPPPYVAANLDFTGEPRLQALVDSGVFRKNVIVTTGGTQVGVIGLDTPNLPFVSSPRNVVVDTDLVTIVQAQVDAFLAGGVNKIVLASHLQGIEEEQALVAQVSGLDVVIAGGGDELLANMGDTLIPGDEENIFGPYPILATDKDGATVPIVTTSGEYKYLGELELGFDADGVVVRAEGGPKIVTVTGPEAVTPDPTIQMMVVDPVSAALAQQAATVVGVSEVALDGQRSPGVRTMETNEGNLIADSQLWQAQQLAAGFGVKAPDVALQNGGGIRNNTVIPAGDISVLDTFDMVPFPNFVTVLEDIPAAQFKEIMENAVSRVEGGSGTGRFAQVAGMSFVYDVTGTPIELDDDGNVVTPGTRVVSVFLDDGTPIVEGGSVAAGAPPVTVAIVDFLARGGDEYPFRDHPFTVLGVSYQQALRNYIEAPVADGGLGGSITAVQYPEGGEGRIVAAEGATLGVVDPGGRWSIPGSNPLFFGVPGDTPFLGDWDGDGVATPGLYRESEGFAYVTNGLATAVADTSWFMGNPNDIPLVGDWDGDGVDTFGVYRPSEGRVYLRNSQTTGIADVSYFFGQPGDTPFAGDFDGDGIDTVGLYRESAGLVYFRNSQTTGIADAQFFFGDPSDVFLGGDWNGNGTDTVGVVRPAASTFFFRNSNTQGVADGDYAFNPAMTPVVKPPAAG